MPKGISGVEPEDKDNEGMNWLRRVGSHPWTVWVIKHVVSPLDRAVVRVSRGRLRPPSSLVVPTLLLTTVGHRSGRERTIPLVYVSDDVSFIVANARPAGERPNPWVTNVRAAGRARVNLGRRTIAVEAQELGGPEIEQWWPTLVELWPAFGEHYRSTGERAVFALHPIDA